MRKHSWKFEWRQQTAIVLGMLGLFILISESSKYISPSLSKKQRTYFAGSKDKEPYERNVILGDSSQPTSFLLLGDSHAHALSGIFAEIAEKKQKTGRLLYVPTPFLNTYIKNDLEPPIKLKELVQDAYEVVYITMRWAIYSEGYLPSETSSPQPIKGLVHYKNATEEYYDLEAISHGLQDTIDFFLERGVQRIYLVLPTPEHHFVIPTRSGNLTLFYDDAAINKKLSVSLAEYNKRNARSIAMLKGIEEKYGAVTVLDPIPMLTLGEHFNVVENGKPLFYDDDHLSTYGARKLAPLFTLEP